ncbi:MAG: iron uptake transporter deferrochelatase/peroxidase subunit [Pseudonocardiaceae bacterium]
MTSERYKLSRRALVGLLGAGAVAGAGAATAMGAAAQQDSAPSDEAPAASGIVPFHGVHQAGIVTAVQDRLHFAAFDLSPAATRADLVALLKSWTAAAVALCGGTAVGPGGAVNGALQKPPTDTGEAQGLPASQVTITVGFGTTLFHGADGRDRFGLAAQRPAQLADLPAFAGDALVPENSGGDLCVQACANDPQVAVHAIRNLARIARGTAVVRYSQLGFGRTSSTSTSQQTARNLMGFKDGTSNIKAEDTATVDRYVWARHGDGPAWMTDGSYLVSRRIRMLIEPWDSTPLAEQERVIGRAKGTGAPLGATTEFDPLDFSVTGAYGKPLIDEDAHVRLAHSSNNSGAQLLRRGYNFVDGTDALGRLEAGLFFLAYQRDPRTQFVTINTHLAGNHNDALNEYIQHVSSGLFACPPGVQPGQYLGHTLLG